ncbi:WD40-repeat-containing domain protein [Lineolata rhizophorae]|uniref:WD40-repeat-containing domain protein n=1 Tax=Lineolata rhizophorae TaxID=578093 RepID=A0A6A6P4C9_9PEZI|nr:WD40-repeat-containing domain protein [Lineolata rhizophorae]
MLSCVLLLSDSSTMISGSADNTLRTWDADSGAHKHTFQGHTDNDLGSGQCLQTLQDHPNYVSIFGLNKDVATQFVNRDTDLLMSSAADGTIRTWSWHDGSILRVLEAHTGAVRGLVWVGKDRFVSGGIDGKLCLWNYGEGQPSSELRERMEAVWHLMGGQCKLATASKVEVGKHLVEIWDLCEFPRSEAEGLYLGK